MDKRSRERDSAHGEPEPARIARLATLDDQLIGMGAVPPDDDAVSADQTTKGGTTSPSDSAVDSTESPAALDALLLLRQVAAMEREFAIQEPAFDHADDLSIEPYEILGRLGEGGFSTVLEALDPRITRRLALKVIRPEAMLMPGMRRRFLREAEIAAKLSHPGIVTILDVGVADGRVFIAQELCQGGSLADWLAKHEGPVPAGDAAAFVLELTEATAYAHAHGVLHRDLKPANILLVPRQPFREGENSRDLPLSSWRPKVADFGLATLQTDETGGQLTRLTAAGCRLGTPAWMAPEQIDSTYGAVAQPTDVYAIGLILQRLLTGEPSNAAESDAESYRRILLEPTVSADRVVAGIPPDVAAVSAKCLQKKPADRYQSAAGLAEDLRRFLSGRPTAARPLSPMARFLYRLQAAPLLTALLAVVVVTAAAAGWVIWEWRSEQSLRLRQAATSRRKDAAAELLNGFNAWRSGNVDKALVSLEALSSEGSDLPRSLAARWLATRLHGEEAILYANSPGTPLYGMALSTDRSLAAVGSADGTLAIVPLSAKSPAARAAILCQVDEEINDVSFVPGTTAVAVVGQMGTLSVWDTLSGRQTHRCNWGQPLYGVACSPDATWIATGGEECLVRLARPEDPTTVVTTCDLTTIRTGEKANAEIESLCFVTSDTLAVAIGHQLVFVEATQGRVLSAIDAFTSPTVIERLGHSSTSNLLCTVGGGQLMPKVWDATSGKAVGFLPQHPAWVQDCCFSADGKVLATAGRDGVIRVFDATSLTETHRLVGHRGPVWQVELESPTSLLSAGGDGTVRRWDLDRNPARFPPGLVLSSPPGSANRTDSQPYKLVSPEVCRTGSDQLRIAVVDEAGSLQLYDPVSGDWDARRIPIDILDPRLGIESSPDGRRLAAPRGRNPTTLINLDDDGSPFEVPLPGVVGRDWFTRWMCDGQLASIHTSDQRLYLRNIGTGRRVALDRSNHSVGFQALAATSQPPMRIFAADHDRLKIYTLDSSMQRIEPDRYLQLASADIKSAAWSPDGTLIACGAKDGSVWLYDIDDPTPPRVVTTHWHSIRGLVFDEAGQTLISIDSESMRIHDPVARVTLDEYSPGWEITGIAILPDDRAIALTGDKGLAMIPLRPRPGDRQAE